MKSQKGITLIVLVITIIVLIVLAGVAIASLSGNNSIIDRAQESKTKSEEAAANEEIKIGEYESMISRTIGQNKGGDDLFYNVTINNLSSANLSGLGLNTYEMAFVLFESETGTTSELIVFYNGEHTDVRFVPDIDNDDLWYWWDYENNGPWVAPKGDNDEKIAPDETSFSLQNVKILTSEETGEGIHQLSDTELSYIITKTQVN